MSKRLPASLRLASWCVLVCLGLELHPSVAAGLPASRLDRVLSLGRPAVIFSGSRVAFEDGGVALALPFGSAPGLSAAGAYLAGDDPAGIHSAGDDPSEAGEGTGASTSAKHGRSRNATITGTALFASGLFLCSWGITSWQREEDQCCPPRNTENVIKITVGIVLIDAGLVYLLGGVE